MLRTMLIIIYILLVHELSGQQSLIGRFGFGFGYSTGFELNNFSKLNRQFLKASETGLSNNFQLSGLTGYFYFLIIPDTRISFNYLNGAKDIQSSIDRSLRYNQELWNIGFEYTFSINYLNISPGLLLGKVTDFIELVSYNGSQNFSDFVNNFNQQIFFSNSINFENISFMISPSLSVEYSLSRFVAARINYSYLIRLNENWKFLQRYKVENFPDDILGHNHIFNFGILIGFMSK